MHSRSVVHSNCGSVDDKFAIQLAVQCIQNILRGGDCHAHGAFFREAGVVRADGDVRVAEQGVV